MSETKDKKKNKQKPKLSIKIQKKKVFRATDPLLAVFMWGVNYTHNELRNINMPVLLMPDDFKAYIKVKVDNQYFNKDILPSHYKWKEYCPMVFKNLRERFNISYESYLKSLANGLEALDCCSGKSGAKFYITDDRRYVLKTVTSEDIEVVHDILSDYHKHVVETNGQTLLPHYLGLYRLTVEDKENYIIVMRNVFTSNFKVHTKYDIKGSTVDRAAKQKEKEKGSPTFKDNDLISEGRCIHIGDLNKKEFMEKLTSDVNFLASLKLMDYSLLIGIHDLDRAQTETEKNESDENLSQDDEVDTDDDQLNLSVPTPPDSPNSRHQYGIFGAPSSEDKREIYFMALIDILTHYGLKKKSANVAKTVKYGQDQEISTVKPEQYSKRFLDFINKIIV